MFLAMSVKDCDRLKVIPGVNLGELSVSRGAAMLHLSYRQCKSGMEYRVFYPLRLSGACSARSRRFSRYFSTYFIAIINLIYYIFNSIVSQPLHLEP